ncbi:DUF2125 domain-containing protein [Yoonia sp. 208BN28-4]|uniref:DUF2125 domain-containing protein n=1 Tax=Yoonia sp. 208BN28-4 TaxID=3126505 RepID=UPI0030A08A49
MNVFHKLKGAVSVAAVMTGSAAVADVTAMEVWEDWQENLAIYGEDGMSVGSEDVSDGTVTITDLTLSMEDEYSSVTATIGTMTFTENGDGTVTVTMDDSYPIFMDLEGTPVNMTVLQEGMNLVVSGEADDILYDINADSYGIRIDSIEDVEGDMLLTANGVAGQFGSTAEDGGRELGYQLAAASIDLLVDIKEPGGDGYVVGGGKIDNFETRFGAFVPDDTDYDKPEEMFANGFGFGGGYGFSSANYLFDFNADGESAAGTIQMGEGELRAAMESEEVSYRVNTKDLAVTMQSNQLPFPVNVSASEYGINFYMPLEASDEPVEFGTGIVLADLTINDELWMMADPSGTLPRDPATIELDLYGTAKLFFDLLDPAQMEAAAQSDIPGELNSLTLETLKIAAVGALIEGNGAFTFDNSDLETFDGLPRPTGEINLTINGANAVIDNLVSMGLLPEDQAMMGRMMMGMFARSVGDDQLESKLEINDEGHILANGQRIQ